MSRIWFVTSGMKKDTFSFFYVANGCYLTSFFLFFRKVPFWLSNMCKNSKKWSILIRPQELLTAASLLLEDTRHSLIGNAIGLRLEKTNSAYTEGILKSIPFLRQCTEVRFASFFSGGFITAIAVNPPERRLAKRTSMQCAETLIFHLFCLWKHPQK